MATTVVNTDAALRALSAPAVSGARAATMGFHAIGDGGGGAFHFDLSSTADAITGMIIRPEGTAEDEPGRWFRVFDNNTLKLKWFGAKVDNATDDADAFDAINAWLDYAYPLNDTPRGVTIELPTGRCLSTREWRINHVVHIKGTGRYINSQLIFDSGDPANPISGIILDRGAIDDPFHSSYYSLLENFTIYGPNLNNIVFPPNPAISDYDPLSYEPSRSPAGVLEGSGLVMLVRATCDHVMVSGFLYDGFHVEAIADFNNSNGWCLRSCIGNSNGRHGLYVAGDNGNAGYCSNFDANANAGWNIYDRGFLGNTYIGCQVAEGGLVYVRDIHAIVVDPSVSVAGINTGLIAGGPQAGANRAPDTAIHWRTMNVGLQNVTDPVPYNTALRSAISCFASDPDTNKVWAGSPASTVVAPAALAGPIAGGGVFRCLAASDDTWLRRVSGLTDTDVRALAFGDSVLYAGTHTGGVFKSTDAGDTWAAANTSLGNLDVRALACDPANAGTVYAGTFGGKVYKSTNHGGSWAQVATGFSSTNVLCLAMKTGLLYAGCSDGKVYKTTDGGANWSLVLTASGGSQINGLAIDPSDNTIALAATGGAYVYKTSNTGGSWTQLTSGLVAPFDLSAIPDIRCVAIRNDGLAYCGVQAAIRDYSPNSNPGGVFVLEAGDSTWVSTSVTLRQAGGYASLSRVGPSVFDGCYVESDQNNWILAPSVVIGGILGGAIDKDGFGGDAVVIASTGITNAPVYAPIIESCRNFVAGPGNALCALSYADRLVRIDATGYNVSAILPPPSAFPGQKFTIQRVDAGASYIVISASGNAPIDGDTYLYLTRQYDTIVLLSNGSGYTVLSHTKPPALVQIEEAVLGASEYGVAGSDLGDFTLGTEFQVTREGIGIQGMKFYWPVATARTVKVTLRQSDGTLITTRSGVAISGVGEKSVFFDNPIKLDPFETYKMCVYEDSGTSAFVLTIASLATAVPPGGSWNALVAGQGYLRVRAVTAAGDANPTTDGSAYLAMQEPIFE